MSNYRRNVIFNAGSTALGSLAQLALVAILARLISKDALAEYVTAAAFVAVGEIASDFGTRIWATRTFALATSQANTFLVAILSKFFYTMVFAFLSISVRFTVLGTEQILLCGVIAMTQPSTDPLLWYLRGKERLDLEAIVVLIYRVLNALVLCGIVYAFHSVTCLLLGWLTSNIIRVLCESILTQTRHLMIGLFDEINLLFIATRKVIVLSFPVGIAFLLIAVYQRLGVFVLGIQHDAVAVADFGVAFTLVAPAGFLATSITVSAFPRLVRAIEANDYDAAQSVVRKKLVLISVIFIPCCIVGLFTSPIVIDLIYGPRYQDAGTLMVLMLSGLYISSVTFALKYTLNSIHLNWWDAFSVVVAIATFLFITLNAPPGEEAKYAAVAWCLGESMSFVIKFVALRLNGRITRLGLEWVFVVFVFLLILSLYAAEHTTPVLAWWHKVVN